eukprot:gene19386-25254_t
MSVLNDNKPLNPLKLMTCAGLASMMLTNSCLADVKPVITYNLEKSIESLENAESRQEVVQSLADLYEASGAKTLLARSKYKYRINDAINKQHEKFGSNWDQILSYESKELKRRVDPFRTADLSSYLKIAPFIGGALYLGTLFVQQSIPELFIFAYPAAVFVLVIPVVYIVLTL